MFWYLLMVSKQRCGLILKWNNVVHEFFKLYQSENTQHLIGKNIILWS